MTAKNLTFETTAGEAALSTLIYVHLIRGSLRSTAVILSATLILAFTLLLIFNEDPEIELLERPLEALLILFGTFGSWMFMRFWNYRRAMSEDIGRAWRVAIRLDSDGAHWLLKNGDHTMKWREFSGAKSFGNRLYLLPKEGGHIVLYRRAFTSRQEFLAYADSVQEAIGSASA
jgi:hypothetical protein